MKLIGDAAAGQLCYSDLTIIDDEMLDPKMLNEHFEYAKKDVQCHNVFIMNVEPFRSHDDVARGSITFRFNCIKLAEPDMSKLKEFFKI
jgi:hypothetical protein